MGRQREADSCMKVAWPKGTTNDITYYGYKLMMRKQYKEALAAFKVNYDKAPKSWESNYWMARASAGMGDKTAAMKYADASVQLAEDKQAKAFAGQFRQKVVEGKDVTGM